MEETRVVTESEWKILQQLWQHEPLTIMQLTHALEQETGWSKHTIISFLNRMDEKDYVFYQDSGKARQYYSLIDYQTALEQEIGALRRKTALHTPVKTLALILQSYRLSAKDCQALIQVLEEMQKLEKKQA